MTHCIAVLLKDVDEDDKRKYAHQSHSLTLEERYINYLQPYTKHIALISPWETKESIIQILNRVNGVLLPGGVTNIYTIIDSKQTISQYTKAAQIIIDYAIQKFNEGNSFPIYGICLGFEAMVAGIAGIHVIEGMENCINYNCNVIPLRDVKSSKILSGLTQQSLEGICNSPLVFNNHYYSVRLVKWSEVESNGILKCVSKSLSKDGKEECVTIVEGNGYPFYGVQFHPEVSLKAYFNSNYSPVISAESARIAKELMGMFVAECNKCKPIDLENIPLYESIKGERVINKFNEEICIMWEKFKF